MTMSGGGGWISQAGWRQARVLEGKGREAGEAGVGMGSISVPRQLCSLSGCLGYSNNMPDRYYRLCFD